MRHQHGFQPEPYPFVMRGPNESFEMESFEYEQQRTVDRATPKPRAALRAALQADVTSCKPGDVLDCSNILLPEAPTPEERKRITPGGALAEGASHDVTSSVTKALKALHLTHYDVNDWTISKKKHQYAIAEITEFIDRHLSRNPGVLKVTITGSASRTGTKKYNDILSCRRAKEAAKLIRLGLWGYQKKTRPSAD